MKILTSADQINTEFIRLVNECRSCQIAVAWATVRFKAFDQLIANRAKLERMIVGLDLCHTHPTFIESFLKDHQHVRFAASNIGVFHPKIYLFEKSNTSWECVLGSPNFTKSAFHKNAEVAVLLRNDDLGAQEAYRALTETISDFWRHSTILSREQLHAYQTAWQESRKHQRQVKRKLAYAVRSLISEIPAKLTVEGFTSLVRSGIERELHDVAERWTIGRSGVTLTATHREATLAASRNRLAAPLNVQLWLDPKSNRCSFEIAYSRQTYTAEAIAIIRDPMAELIRGHIQRTQLPANTEMSKGSTMIRLKPFRVTSTLANSQTESNGIEFSRLVGHAVTFFRFIDQAMRTFNVSLLST